MYILNGMKRIVIDQKITWDNHKSHQFEKSKQWWNCCGDSNICSAHSCSYRWTT